jgi:5-oxoprolinase (ATP-hydrolysing)
LLEFYFSELFSRSDIFDLEIKKPELLYEEVIEIDERIRVIHPSIDPLNSKNVQVGITNERVEILKSPDPDLVYKELRRVYDKGIRSLCVSFMHSYTYSAHEKLIGDIASKIGFTNVSLSSVLMPMVKIVPRAFTCNVDAYLTPCIHLYISQFVSGFDSEFLNRVKVQFMQSDGGLAPVNSFNGFRAVLSGPAGGVIGYSKTCYDKTSKVPVIGFDMGGTSTDVSRFAGNLEHIFENNTAGVCVQAPQLDINTVAAGGGSRLFFKQGLFVVGPESAGANPGPACYGLGGPLTVTDANLILGRILPSAFPPIFGPLRNERLNYNSSRMLFEELTKTINSFYQGDRVMSAEEVALGFIRVANEAMCRPIRSLTHSKGFNAASHQLAVFGGAGSQHACAVARNLSIKSIFIHRLSGILSAYGIGLADVVYDFQEPCAQKYQYDREMSRVFKKTIDELTSKGRDALNKEGFSNSRQKVEVFLNMRFEGTDTALMIPADNLSIDLSVVFHDRYIREFGFYLERSIIVDDIRVRMIGVSETPAQHKFSPHTSVADYKKQCEFTQIYFAEKGWTQTKMYHLEDLPSSFVVPGPALILDKTTTILVDPWSTARIDEYGHVVISVDKISASSDLERNELRCDPILLSIFSHRFMSIAEQMGKTLQRTSISTNIKERLDFSCAIFGPDGGLVANAPHLPVHLGSMQEAVKFQKNFLGKDWKKGEVILANHPMAGGSHLPDITVITPVWGNDSSNAEPLFFLASRGHHADIGGISPGSMPPFSKFLSDEGAAIISFKLVKSGVFDEEGITNLLVAAGSRCISDNLSDLKAQVAANERGRQLFDELISEYGLRVIQAYMHFIQANAESAVREMLKGLASRIGSTQLSSVDFMDDGTKIELKITIDEETGSAAFDFLGTGSQVYGNTNSPKAVAYSSIIYCLRCLIQEEIPLNQGCLSPISVTIPDNSILSPSSECAVVGGNVLTSQRVTDVILKAFQACADSQGCMNNLTFGDSTFGYYETIAGGAGAGPSWNGKSGVHTHMTNTRITDPEILERRYPVELNRFILRTGSGGDGKYRGGDGIIREITFLKELTVSILSERRSFEPCGIRGGKNGERGYNHIIRSDGVTLNLGGKNTYNAKPGDRILICTPGGGGYGER